MKKNFGIVLAIALGLSALLLTIGSLAGWVKANPFAQEERTGAPTIVSYQGQIWDGDTPYNGTGYFKFAIIDSFSTQTWSNDGNNPPTTSVPLTVDNGLFSVNLGAAGMAPIAESAFPEATTFLRVWFSPNNSTWTQMPDQQIASVPYALRAQEAYNASYFDNMKSSDFQLRVTDPCPSGQAIKQINADGSVICEAISGMPRFTLSVIHNDPLTSSGFYPSIGVGADGLGLISFTNDDQILIVAHCDDLECTTATLNAVDLPAYADNSTSLVIRPGGHALISYYDSNYQSLKVAYCNNADCSDTTITTIDNTLAGIKNAIASMYDLYSVIGYTGGNSFNTLHVASCDTYNCSSFVSGFILDNTATVYHLDVIFGADNRGLIVYGDSSSSTLKTAHCDDMACLSATLNTIASGISATDISLALGSDNLGLISFQDIASGDLKVAHCDDIVCSSATIYTLDDNRAGYGSSIAIGMDGLGVISYYNYSGDLRVAHCIDLACSAATLNTLHDTNDSGYPVYWTSIAIGKDGMPLIAYQRRGDGTLNSAHCSNVFCMPTELP